MKINFFENIQDKSMYPLNATRPVADLRVGILSLAEKWALCLKAGAYGFQTRIHLQEAYPEISADIFIWGNLIPDENLVHEIQLLQPDTTLLKDGHKLAYRGSGLKLQDFAHDIRYVHRPYHIFKYNGSEILKDFQLITQGRSSKPLSSSNQHFGTHPVFLEEGAIVECCILNTTQGPIYIGKNAQIMEGSMVRGPFAMGEGSNVKMGSKIYGDTTLGPYCNVGGEVNNVVFQSFSNKGHDGFLGNAVIGSWCNIGADTNASNLKNTYDEVKVWNYETRRFERSGEQFCGLIMGDHSKCGINTMFNTGTVVGVAANIFGPGFPRPFIPDFSWGGSQGFVTHQLPQMEKTASLMMSRRKRAYDSKEQAIIHHVFKESQEFRSWELEETSN
jgi:UDP-N-acetylglucosamine diphosphorylase/glucosamine-1-phosphate N-acetyltransferase